jgi:FkbM family methyltransferase
MSKIVFYTQSYNAEKYIGKTIESVLAQTMGDFVYYITDDCSTDGTREVIKSYAEKDSRIRTIFKEKNHYTKSWQESFDTIYKECPNSKYMAVLDADDFYTPDFAEYCCAQMDKGVDLVICSSEFFNNETNATNGQRTWSNEATFTIEQAINIFPNMHQHFRTTWGKMFNMEIQRKHNVQFADVFDGIDTTYIFAYLPYVKNLFITNKILHKYRMYTASFSYTYRPNRLSNIKTYMGMQKAFLEAKGGYTPQNTLFLSTVCIGELLDGFKVLMNNIVNKKTIKEDPTAWINNDFLMNAWQTLLTFQQSNIPEARKIATEQLNRYCKIFSDYSKQAFELGLDELCIKIREFITLTDVASSKSLLSNPATKPNTDNVAFTNGCDLEFYTLIEKIKTTTVDELLKNLVASATSLRLKNYEYFGELSKWYKSWYRISDFDVREQNFTSYFGGMYNYLKQQTIEFTCFYESLCNYRSKWQLKNILSHWISFEPDIRKSGSESTFAHYYDLDIMQCDENEVFVDCGTFTGDTILSFMHNYGGRYKSIYGYELTPSTYEKARKNLKEYKSVHVRNAGVGDKNGTIQFADFGGEGDANRIMQGGNVTGNIVALDEDITENITFIKMDIEGAEMAALIGAQNHIKRSKPKLAISLYHKLSDIIEIPKFIHQLVPEYKFYFQHFPEQFPFPTEYVLLAVCDSN